MSKQSRMIMLIGYLVSILANGIFVFGGVTLLIDPSASTFIYGLWLTASLVMIVLSLLGLIITFMPIDKSAKWRFVSILTSTLNMTPAIFFIIHMETTGGDSPTYFMAFSLAAASLLLLGGFFRSFEKDD